MSATAFHLISSPADDFNMTHYWVGCTADPLIAGSERHSNNSRTLADLTFSGARWADPLLLTG